MLLIFSESCKNQHRESRTFLLVVNEIRTCTVNLHDIVIVKNALVKSVCYIREYTICSVTGFVKDEQFLLWI
jgi:hypothetical protein